ncbi:MAG: glycosyltransferase N-terminal domain-containing protein [Chitinophagaceae bacterium]
MFLIIYNLFLAIYKTGMMLVKPWNRKAELWLEGRKNIFQKISGAVPSKGSSQLIWMHCASLGEFEQGRPVLETIRALYPQTRILITFFSASGYEIQKNYPGADYIAYLPADSPANAIRFLDIVQPALILWVKYEFWYHYLIEVKKRNIANLLISGIFLEKQLFFKWYGGPYKTMLHCFTHLFVQTQESKKLLAGLGLTQNVSISGDTRFDRVIQIAEKNDPLPVIESFCGEYPVVVAGSTWPEDEEELDHYANTHPGIRFIIAPHEIGKTHLEEVKKLFTHSIFYSQIAEQPYKFTNGNRTDNLEPVNVLVIDNIGMLSRLYKYATITYVGGGFGNSGVHNVIEAAVYGKPVVIGPVYQKFAEAVALVNCGGAFSIKSAIELDRIFNRLLQNRYEYTNSCEASRNYVFSNKGANDKIQQYISTMNLLNGK